MVNDTRTAETDPKFRKTMQEIHQNMMSDQDGHFDDQYFMMTPDLGRVAQYAGFPGLAAAVGRMTPAMQTELLQTLRRFPFVGSGAVSVTNQTIKAVNTLGD